jgi:hypothetical protein
MGQLQRTTFEVSRASEYFDARQLSALTGVPQTAFASVCLKELVDNSLDACETAGAKPEIAIAVSLQGGYIKLTVSDNGPGIPPEVVHRILDYSVRVSDKAAYRSPTRGAQGNALKTVIGIPYSLGSREPLIVKARGIRHAITPWVDPAGGVHFTHDTTQEITEGTMVSLLMPAHLHVKTAFGSHKQPQNLDALHWARSFAAFNAHATISYRVRTALQKHAKFTNGPWKAPSRSMFRVNQQARTGTVWTPSRASSSTTSPTPAPAGVTYQSASSCGSLPGSHPPRRRRP